MDEFHFVFRSKPECGFDFYDEFFFDQEIGKVKAYLIAFIENGKFRLLLDRDALFLQFQLESVFVDFF